MELSAFAPFFAHLAETRLAPWVETLAERSRERLGPRAHGDWPRWSAALAALPALEPGRIWLDRAAVGCTGAGPLAPGAALALRRQLMALHPWRKGPYSLHGLRIDTEWRSDWKWNRLASHIAPLDGRLVLDVGCGNGYHAWRMLGAGARLVLGIDPTQLFVAQFRAINHFLRDERLAVLPLGIEELPEDLGGFDTVFSMGVLYHRRSPLDHLLELRRLLRPGGELVLETLVLAGAGQELLVPPGRYAGMRNLWFIPTVAALAQWLERCGFESVRCIHCAPTTSAEQRASAWMRFHSLADQLDPQDPSRTREGHPAPVRALLIARSS